MLDTLEFGAVEIEDLAGGDHVDPHVAALRRMGQGAAGAAELSGSAHVSRRSAEAALRRHGAYAAAADGRRSEDARRSRRTAQSERTRAARAAAFCSASDSDSWKAVNRAWQNGGKVWRNTRERRLRDLRAEPAAGRRSRGRASACTRASSPAWTKAGRAGCWNSSASPTPACTTRTSPAGHLRDRFDTLVFPDQIGRDRSIAAIPARMPEEYRGGLGEKGAAALREFAAAGGTLVFLNRSSEYAIEHLGIKAKNVVSGVSNKDFYVPGSLLNVKLDCRPSADAGAAGRDRDLGRAQSRVGD